MRVRATAAACLLAVGVALVGCGTDDGSATDRPGPTGSPTSPPASTPTSSPSSGLLADPASPPAITVTGAAGSVTALPGSYCWQSSTGAGMCADAASVDPAELPLLTGPGPARFAFPVEGWSFTATFNELRDQPRDDSSATVDAEQTEPGLFTLEPPSELGDFRVDLVGTGPQGDYAAVFRWQLRVEDSPSAA